MCQGREEPPFDMDPLRAARQEAVFALHLPGGKVEPTSTKRGFGPFVSVLRCHVCVPLALPVPRWNAIFSLSTLAEPVAHGHKA